MKRVDFSKNKPNLKNQPENILLLYNVSIYIFLSQFQNCFIKYMYFFGANSQFLPPNNFSDRFIHLVDFFFIQVRMETNKNTDKKDPEKSPSLNLIFLASKFDALLKKINFYKQESKYKIIS